MSFQPGQQIAYIPNHASGPEDPAAEYGFVTSVNSSFVFCRFFRKREGSDAVYLQSQGCFAKNLRPYQHRDQAIIDRIMAHIGG